MTTPAIRPCRDDDFDAILAIINAAAQAYRGVIPADCWHEPYMPTDALRREIAAGVTFHGASIDSALVGVMGFQAVRNVDLIRHAYVAPAAQGHGVGGSLMDRIKANAPRPILVGAWEAAAWAVAFYRRHGFGLVSPTAKAALLRAYWTVSPRQIETSVVLALPALDDAGAAALIAQARPS